MSTDVTTSFDSHGTAIVTGVGEFDHANVRQLSRAVLQALAARPRGIVVDLDQARFLGAAVLSTLIRARKTCRHHGVRLTVHCTEPRLRRLFTITDLENLLLEDPVIVDFANERAS